MGLTHLITDILKEIKKKEPKEPKEEKKPVKSSVWAAAGRIEQMQNRHDVQMKPHKSSGSPKPN
ncbi:MAG: hypothetical protein MI742_00750 [Desulfobacterales bacterium]|nr:hypothetical protein [Desulfobacterales bacterium]